jgi:hypothetical protein
VRGCTELLRVRNASGDDQRFRTHYCEIDQLHRVVQGGVTQYASSDASGNVLGLFNRSTNAVSGQHPYQPFGTIDRNDHLTSSPTRWKRIQYDK